MPIKLILSEEIICTKYKDGKMVKELDVFIIQIYSRFGQNTIKGAK